MNVDHLADYLMLETKLLTKHEDSEEALLINFRMNKIWPILTEEQKAYIIEGSFKK